MVVDSPLGGSWPSTTLPFTFYRQTPVQVCQLEKLFIFAFETNGRNFESTVVFFLNSNVKLKYIYIQISLLILYESNFGAFITNKLVSDITPKLSKYKIKGKYNVMHFHMKK